MNFFDLLNKIIKDNSTSSVSDTTSLKKCISLLQDNYTISDYLNIPNSMSLNVVFKKEEQIFTITLTTYELKIWLDFLKKRKELSINGKFKSI